MHQNKIPISTNDMDINKIVVSNKLPFGKQDIYRGRFEKNATIYIKRGEKGGEKRGRVL